MPKVNALWIIKKEKERLYTYDEFKLFLSLSTKKNTTHDITNVRIHNKIPRGWFGSSRAKEGIMWNTWNNICSTTAIPDKNRTNWSILTEMHQVNSWGP